MPGNFRLHVIYNVERLMITGASVLLLSKMSWDEVYKCQSMAFVCLSSCSTICRCSVSVLEFVGGMRDSFELGSPLLYSSYES